jgi:outer membrane receptor protein involved in Fe transport
VTRKPTPRYECGYETHFDTIGEVHSNGGQIYGREIIEGGSDDWGFRATYGDRSGSDYRAGSGELIPSAFHNRDERAELSFDVNPNRRVDVAFQRLDQTNTDYPCEFFNVDALGSYGFETHMVDTDPLARWTKLSVDGWYNHTNFRGSTPVANPFSSFPVIDRVDASLSNYYGTPTSVAGTTNGNVASSGVRAGMTFGDLDDAHINIGADFRYVEQFIKEDYTFTQTPPSVIPPPPQPFETNMPHSRMTNPGLYAEWAKPVTDAWTTAVGARLDVVNTTTRGDWASASQRGKDYSENDVLYAFYNTNTFKLNERWNLTAGFGQAQRPPTLIERYADGLFISSLQSGFTRVIGDPNLQPERSWQIDLGLNTDQDRWRGKVNCFQSWVVDYVTYADDSVNDMFDARLLRFINTPLATLSGFEAYGEYDLSLQWTSFAKMSYVQGWDQSLNAPLPGISPFESTVGLRYHDPDKGRRWGLEGGARMVATQDELGQIRLLGVGTVVEERTPGFTTCYIRGYWKHKNLRLIAGIDNVFNRNYQEHLDLRVTGPDNSKYANTYTRVLATGFSPYAGFDWAF